MADVELTIGAEPGPLKKDLKKVRKILDSFSKQTISMKRKEQAKTVEGEKRTTRFTIAEQKVRDRNDRRLSRKRARVRLKQIKARISAEKRADREIEKNRKNAEKRRGRLVRGVGRGIGRAGGGLARAAAFQFDLVGIGLQIANFQKRVIQLGEQADLSLTDEKSLSEAITKTSLATGKSKDELLDFVKATFDTGGGIKLATQNLDEMARSMVAFSSDAIESGRLLSSIKNFGIAGPKAAGIVDVIAELGKAGAISPEDFGRIGPELFGAAANKGFRGREGIAQVGALAQFAARGSSGPEASKTAVVALLSGLLDKSSVIGKQLEISTTKGGKVVNPFENIKKIVSSPKATDILLSKIFGRDAARLLGPLRLAFERDKGFSEIDRFVKSGVEAKGRSSKIFGRISETSGFKIDQLTALIRVLADKALLAGVTELIKGMTKFLDDDKKIKTLVNDLEQIGQALAGLAKLANTLLPLFQGISAPVVAISRAIDDPKTLITPAQREARGGSGFSGARQQVKVINNMKLDPAKKTVTGKTTVEQNNPSTGKITRTHIPIRSGVAF